MNTLLGMFASNDTVNEPVNMNFLGCTNELANQLGDRPDNSIDSRFFANNVNGKNLSLVHDRLSGGVNECTRMSRAECPRVPDARHVCQQLLGQRDRTGKRKLVDVL